MKVLTWALSFSALLILWRPLYSNFHRTRQFSFASGVISKHWHGLAAVAWLQLVLCVYARVHPVRLTPTPDLSGPSIDELLCLLHSLRCV